MRVAVALSGGIDSALSAFILKKIGFKVTGVLMQNWNIQKDLDCSSSGCSIQYQRDFEPVQRICDYLQIPLKTINFVREYWENVFEETMKGYRNHLTPNPDILCNRYIKFGSLYRNIISEYDFLATGHYAQNQYQHLFKSLTDNLLLDKPYKTEFDLNLFKEKKISGQSYIKRSNDLIKDQTFFLSAIPKESLNQILFPIGHLTKDQVYQITSKIPDFKFLLEKKQSMGLCFIEQKSFSNFMSDFIETPEYELIDLDLLSTNQNDIEKAKMNIKHSGFYTIGQRLRKKDLLKRYFVASIRPPYLFITTNPNHSIFYTKRAEIRNLHFISNSANEWLDCKWQHKSNQFIKGRLEGNYLIFKEAAYQLATGQTVSFYQNNYLLGSATISKVFHSDQ